MKIIKVRVHKEYKFGLPNFSNITASCGIDAEVGDKEMVDWERLWDIVNQQLYIQAGGIDPSWITTKEYKNFFKVIMKQPKKGTNER